MSEIGVDLQLTADGLGADSLHDVVIFKVFDGGLNFVGSLKPNDQPISDLSPGAYKITAEMPNGETRERFVVLGEKAITVKFELDLSGSSSDLFAKYISHPVSKEILIGSSVGGPQINIEHMIGTRAISKTQSPVFKEISPITVNLPISVQPYEGSIKLETVDGAVSKMISPGHWTFFGTSREGVSRAQFITARGKIFTALPVTDAARPLQCDVFINPTTHNEELEVRIEISPKRPMVHSMLNLIDMGKTYEAGQLADNARLLLYEKFSDPVGATLGAMILFQLGRLDERPMADWAQNLFSKFRWITDVDILKVATNVSHSEYTSEDYETLLACSEKPVIFTAIYSLMVKNLRSWGGDLSAEQKNLRTKALERLASINTQIDWSAPTVITREASFD